MSNIIKQSFTLNLKLLKILRLYPDENPTFTYIWTSRIAYTFFVILIPLLGVAHFFVIEEMDMIRTVDNTFTIMCSICAMIKISPFIKDMRRLKRCIHYFENPFFHVTREEQKHIIEECINICKRNSFIFICIITTGFVGWATKPLILQNYILPIDVWLPCEVVKGTKSYYVIYFILSIGVLYDALADAPTDPLIGGLACHVAGQLKILKDNLQHLNKCEDGKVSINKNDEYKSQIIYDKIKRCVQHHNAILYFAKEYEECFSLAIFCQLFGSVLIIGFICLQLSVEKHFNFNVFSLITYLLIVPMQIYFYCYYGTIVYEESLKVAEAIYMGEWYTFDIKSRRALLVIMERSRKPILFTAGKLLEVSLETFTTILKRAYSLLAVLKNYS